MKKDQKVLFVSVFLCFAVPAMLFPIFFVEPRYIAFSFWVSGAVFFYALYVRKPIAFNICCKLSPLVLLLPVIQFIKTGCIYKPFSDHPLSSCLKEIPDLKEGLGTYWNTHEVNLFGNSKNPIRAVGPNLKPYHWVNNIDWFKNRRFNFIVTNDPSYSIPLENIRNIVKDELKVIQCENIERSVVVLNKKQEMMLYNYLN